MGLYFFCFVECCKTLLVSLVIRKSKAPLPAMAGSVRFFLSIAGGHSGVPLGHPARIAPLPCVSSRSSRSAPSSPYNTRIMMGLLLVLLLVAIVNTKPCLERRSRATLERGFLAIKGRQTSSEDCDSSGGVLLHCRPRLFT